MVEENDLSFHLRWLPPKPEPLAESWGGKGPRECHSTPSELQRGREGRGEKEAEGERAGREESRVKFSSSPFLVVRPAGSQGKFSPLHVPSPYHGFDLIRLLSRLQATHRQALKDYTWRANAFKTQPSTLHISPPNLEIMPELIRILQLGFLCIIPFQSSCLRSRSGH